MKLYVDDLRKCPEGFIVARNMKEAIFYLENNEIDILSLDHDLGEDEEGNLLPTGYDLVKYMCNHNLSAKKIFIHTDNPVGRENMVSYLRNAKKHGALPQNIEIYHYPIVPNIYE